MFTRASESRRCPGSQIGVFGTMMSPLTKGGTTNASYSIDNGLPVFFAWGMQAGKTYQQRFFQSGLLSQTGSHTLTIVNLVPQGKLILDFINITGATTTTAATATTSSTPAYSIAPSATTTTTSSTTAYSTAPSAEAASGDSPAKHHLPVQKIAGGLVVGIFAAVITLAGVILLKRKNTRRLQRTRANAFPLARK